MGKCVIPSCNRHTDRDSASGVRFFPIPAMRQTGPPGYRRRSELRRRAWLILINNDDLKDEHAKTTRRICSRHFISGQPSAPNDEKNCDWLPSLHVGYTEPTPLQNNAAKTIIEANPATRELPQEQDKVHQFKIMIDLPQHAETDNPSVSAPSVIPTIKEEPPDDADATVQHDLFELAMKEGEEDSSSADTDMVTIRCDDYRAMEEELLALRNENADLKKSYTRLRNQLTEAEVDKLELNAELSNVKHKLEQHAVKESAFEEETTFLKGKIGELEICVRELQEEEKNSVGRIADLEVNIERTRRCAMSLELLKDNDYLNFYTGLPNYRAFEASLKHIRLRVAESRCVLAPWQCFLLTLMRLRLSLTLQDLAYRFAISTSTACNVCERWLYHMYKTLDSFIVWPSRDVIKKAIPDSFKNAFSDKVVVIMHCFELSSDNSKAVDTRAGSQPNAKSRNNVKYLIGITPSGVISFVSHGWEGKSCENVLAESGLYKRLMPGDEILADVSLPPGDSVGWYWGEVFKSDSTSSNVKLISRDITDTRKLAILRSHVHKISSLRRRYRIMRGELPLQDTHKKSAHDVSQIDQIVQVCCALSNIAENHL